MGATQSETLISHLLNLCSRYESGDITVEARMRIDGSISSLYFKDVAI